MPGRFLGERAWACVPRDVVAGWAALCASLLLGAGALTPAPALALPEGRVYEMVSPVYKGGYGATRINAVALNGESVMFFSPGAFAGAPAGGELMDYVARRGLGGWSTASSAVPAALMPYVPERDVSPTLDSTLALGKPGPNLEAAFQAGTEAEFLLHSTELVDNNDTWELVGGKALSGPAKKILIPRYEGASPDFCHLLFDVSAGEALLPEDSGGQLFELDGCDAGSASLRLVGLNNKLKAINTLQSCGETEPNVDPGIQTYGSQSAYNAIAAGGGEVFFTTCVGGVALPHQLFLRLGGVRTIEVSKPVSETCSEVPCKGATERASANFVGASEDGSTVFFTTTQSLVGEDKDKENDLYMARIGCLPSKPECGTSEKEVTSLTQVSHDPVPGEAAEVQGVVRNSPDGSHVYFVAHGVLTNEPGPEGHVPQAGADNMYVYNNVLGKVDFVGDLCSGPELSGTVEDVRCPTHMTGSDQQLWLGGGGEAQTGGSDGSFLVFSTYGQLVASDTDTTRDVYRYDAETGVLDRVSVGEEGFDANGNNDAFDATMASGHEGGTVRDQYEMDNRAVSEDGSRIVFTTAEPLSPGASNGLVNAYEWHQEPGSGVGKVSLISSGSAEEPVHEVVISPGGQDVFFVTVQGLVAQDTDGAPDIYDARLGGGFPPVAAERQPCSGDACQGPLTNPAPLLVPGSVTQAPGGNFAPSVPGQATKPKQKAKPKKKKKTKRNADRKHAKKGKASRRSGEAKKASGRSGR